MKNIGKVYALDAAAKRVEKLKENIARLQLTCIEALKQDATKLVSWEEEGGEKQDRFLPSHIFEPGTFDRILLDAPCSSLGQRPMLVNNIRLGALKGYQKYQVALFRNAVPLLKKDKGTLVYSTCTITPDENESVVAWALQQYPQLRLVSQKQFHLGNPGFPGFGLNEEQCKLVQRFDPTDPQDTIGFFIAKFESNLL